MGLTAAFTLGMAFGGLMGFAFFMAVDQSEIEAKKKKQREEKVDATLNKMDMFLAKQKV